MARDDQSTRAVTFYIGAANLFLAAIWGALYGSGILTNQSILSSRSMLLYVVTMFLAGFGVIFPFVEKTYSDKAGINSGFGFSIAAVALYAAYVGAYLKWETLELKTIFQRVGMM